MRRDHVAFATTFGLLILLCAVPRDCRAGTLSAEASCTGGYNVSFQWTFYDDPGNPAGHPEWVGYDVRRRSLSSCGASVRVNAEPFPRVMGATHGHTYTETLPSAGTMYEYKVVFVDANRDEVHLDPLTCDFCSPMSWTSCPSYTAPLTQGTLEDWGWALFVTACPNLCYHSFYFEDPAMVAELRPYAGSGTAIRFYGRPYCGTVEGCGMNVFGYELSPCGDSTPTARSSWGRVKTIYR